MIGPEASPGEGLPSLRLFGRVAYAVPWGLIQRDANEAEIRFVPYLMRLSRQAYALGEPFGDACEGGVRTSQDHVERTSCL